MVLTVKALSQLSKSLLMQSCVGHIKVPTNIRNSPKPVLISHILQTATIEQRVFLAKVVEQRLESRQRQRTSHRVHPPQPFVPPSRHNLDEFLKLPTQDEEKKCYTDFFNSTSDEVFRRFVCGVCSKEYFAYEEEPRYYPVDRLPHSSALAPIYPHPAHRLFHGLLLAPASIFPRTDGLYCTICHRCIEGLRAWSHDKPFKFSLANNLWTGDQPMELSTLSIAEQLLIGRLYPRGYMFKLYVSVDAVGVQKQLRGTVVTHSLSPSAVAHLVQGRLLPQKPVILAAVISVVLLGKGELNKQQLLPLFRVRRCKLAQALLWLKRNNPKYYGDVAIDDAVLSSLPEDEVPPEILRCVRQTERAHIVVRREHGGYSDADPRMRVEDDLSTLNSISTAIPLEVSGRVDADLTRLTSNELLLRGLSNMWQRNEEGGYVMEYGRPVNQFRTEQSTHPDEVRNFWEEAYPCLFPYGRGGLEAVRPTTLSLRENGQLLLARDDHRFRLDQTFPFNLFSSLQKREALQSVKIQMKRESFARDCELLLQLTPNDLAQAEYEERNHLPFSNPSVKALRRHVFGAARRVMGTDATRYSMRNIIWSTNIYDGPPCLFVTINGADTHDPIVQKLAGKAINVNDPRHGDTVSHRERLRTVADDPYAAAKYHHFIVDTAFRDLFQISHNQHGVKAGMGVLGEIEAIVGLWETQHRGSLHLHFLVWLKNAPSCREMAEMLHDESFRARIEAYIGRVIRAYVPGLESDASISAFPVGEEIPYCRIPDPNSPTFQSETESLELQMAISQQIHKCGTDICQSPKHGKLLCKRRAPWPVSTRVVVSEHGDWCPVRLHPFVVEYNPFVLLCLRCNNNIKFLTNGNDSLNLSFYVTMYAAKKQKKEQNLSALMASGFAYHSSHPNSKYEDTLQHEQSLLLFRVLNTLNRDQEISGQMVMSLVMGWGDTWTSHTYTNIYWTAFVGLLLRQFPDLRSSSHEVVSVGQPTSVYRELLEEGEENGYVEPAFDHHRRQVYERSQVMDYALRPDAWSDMNVMDFLVDTYERPARTARNSDPNSDEPDVSGERYLEDHRRHHSHVRTQRRPGHRNLPNFVGQYFPSSEDESQRDFYYASMLLLVKPWRHVNHDLKGVDETWEEAFCGFMQEKADDRIRRIIANIQFYYSCRTAAENSVDPDTQALLEEFLRDSREDNDLQDILEDDLVDGDEEDEDHNDDSADTLPVIRKQERVEERAYGEAAMAAACSAGVFCQSQTKDQWTVSKFQGLQCLGAEPVSNRPVLSWFDILRSSSGTNGTDATSETQSTSTSVVLQEDGDALIIPANIYMEHHSRMRVVNGRCILDTESPMVETLRDDQYRAYRLIIDHFSKRLVHPQSAPLRLFVTGCPGTGKSRVIHAVTDTLDRWGMTRKLVKAAYTGIAAALIGGKTLHSVMMTGLNLHQKLSERRRRKLQDFWHPVLLFIVDEVSMTDKTLLASLSQNLSIGKEGSVEYQEEATFGGMDVVLFGDFHQFPPVAKSPHERLFYPVASGRDRPEQVLGRRIFEEFEAVVILREQIRVHDPVWLAFLDRLRVGAANQHDVEMLRTLLLHEADMDNVDKTLWAYPSLVTPRHCVRRRWNALSVQSWAESQGRQILVSRIEDRHQGRELNGRLRRLLYDADVEREQNMKSPLDRLPLEVVLVVGMRVFITKNVNVPYGIVNGMLAEVVEIGYHEEDLQAVASGSSVVTLSRVPVYVLVRILNPVTNLPCLPGLEPGVVPVFPYEDRTTVFDVLRSGKRKGYVIHRKQIPLEPAYALTDYRGQGSTLVPLMADIATPKDGGAKLSLFNLYVALSRSRGRDTIRILRDFDDGIIMQKHDRELLEADQVFEELDRRTKATWIQDEESRRDTIIQALHQ